MSRAAPAIHVLGGYDTVDGVDTVTADAAERVHSVKSVNCVMAGMDGDEAPDQRFVIAPATPEQAADRGATRPPAAMSAPFSNCPDHAAGARPGRPRRAVPGDAADARIAATRRPDPWQRSLQMPQAINETTTTAAPPAPDLSAALEQMRRIACEAGDHLLLGDGPPNPDHALLDLCAEAIRLKRASETALAAWRATMSVGNPEYRSALEVHRAAGRAFKKALHHAKKYPAQTSAGIYAKAALVRSSQTGAGVLAMSLADDLLSMPGLRASLWPAGDVA